MILPAAGSTHQRLNVPRRADDAQVDTRRSENAILDRMTVGDEEVLVRGAQTVAGSSQELLEERAVAQFGIQHGHTQGVVPHTVYLLERVRVSGDIPEIEVVYVVESLWILELVQSSRGWRVVQSEGTVAGRPSDLVDGVVQCVCVALVPYKVLQQGFLIGAGTSQRSKLGAGDFDVGVGVDQSETTRGEALYHRGRIRWGFA